MIKTYYLALNKQTHQYFIGYSVLDPWRAFRNEHKTLVNAGNYEDYHYYKFKDLNDVFYFLDMNLIITNGRFLIINKQIKYRQSLKDYLQSRSPSWLVECDKTDYGYLYYRK